MKKLLLFDWGGVIESNTVGYTLYDALYSIFKIISNKEISNDECIKIWKESSVDENGKFFTEINNEKELEEWYLRICNATDSKVNFEEFKRIYDNELNKITVFKDVVDLALGAKDKFKIAILSNLTMLDKNRIDRDVCLEKWDYVFLSNELECRKPDEKIYKIVLEKTGYDPKNILFIDDRKNNIETAKKLGFNTLNTTGNNFELIKKTIDEFENSNHIINY